MKATLERLARDVLAFAQELGVSQDGDFVATVGRQLEHLDVLVVGHYNDGKSTFLNAILSLPEGDQLPTGDLPTTSFPWRLKHGSGRQVRAWDSDRRLLFETTLDEVKGDEFRCQCEAHRDVAFLETQVMSGMIEAPGLAIWDTPGLNDPSELYDPQKLEALLPAVDVIIFVCTYEHHSDLCDELAQFRQQGKGISRFLIVITNADNELDFEEFVAARERRLHEVHENLKMVIGNDAQIFALESRRVIDAQNQLRQISVELRDALDGFLDCSRSDALTSRGWGDELTELSRTIRVSGIVELRSALNDVISRVEPLIAERGLRTIKNFLDQVHSHLTKETAVASAKEDELIAKREQLDRFLAFEPELPAANSCGKLIRQAVREKSQAARREFIEEIRKALDAGLKRAVDVGWLVRMTDHFKSRRRARFDAAFAGPADLARSTLLRRLEHLLKDSLDTCSESQFRQAWAEYGVQTGAPDIATPKRPTWETRKALEAFMEEASDAALRLLSSSDFELNPKLHEEFIEAAQKAGNDVWHGSANRLGQILHDWLASALADAPKKHRSRLEQERSSLEEHEVELRAIRSTIKARKERAQTLEQLHNDAARRFAPHLK